jgi:hypothetical protein
MSCPGIPNFDDIPLSNLQDEYNNLTDVDAMNNFKLCLKTKYSTIGSDSSAVPEILREYQKRLDRNISSTEKNEQSREQYISDVFYLIFKSIIFVILGFFYYLFIRTPQTAIDAIKGATEMVKSTTESIKDTVKDAVKKDNIVNTPQNKSKNATKNEVK